MADNKGRGGSAADNGNDDESDDDSESSADIDAQLKQLQAKKDAASKREAAKRESMTEDDFVGSKPGEPGKFDGEVREPGWRWDRSANDWFEHRGVDYSKRTRAQMPHNLEHTGDGSPTNPHNVRPVSRWS